MCPQNAKEIVDSPEKVRVLIQSGDPVIVILASSFVANYDSVGIDAMRKALQKLGFADVEETAIGATIVKTKYERMLREEEHDVILVNLSIVLLNTSPLYAEADANLCFFLSSIFLRV